MIRYAMGTELTMKKTVLSLEAARAWMVSARHQPLAQRLAYVEKFRDQRSKCRDAIAKAEIALLDAMILDARRPIQAIIQQLEQAIWVFEANGQPHRAGLCWQMLANRHALQGTTAESLLCARRALALAVPEIPVDTRLNLSNTLLIGLCMSLRFDQAQACLEQELLPFMRLAPPSPQLALSWIDAALLHVVAAIRQAKLQSLLTLDLDDTSAACTPEMRQLMQPELALAKHCLNSAMAVDRPTATRTGQYVCGMVQALEGQVEATQSRRPSDRQGPSALRHFHGLAWALRVNGQWAEAVPHLQTGLRLAVDLGMALFERMCCYELALCYEGLNELQAALWAQTRFSVLHARVAAQSMRLSARPQHWRLSVGQALKPAVLAPSEQGQACTTTVHNSQAQHKDHQRPTAPPYVARARRLMEQTLSKRLSLTDLAARVGVRPRSLQQGLAESAGMTFTSCYRKAAMSEAMRLLRLTNLPVGAIALRVGYRSSTSFSRNYKAFCGLAPESFRKAGLPRAAASN